MLCRTWPKNTEQGPPMGQPNPLVL
jgi:hypothetical protein